ncbi:Integrase zinc binding domain [Popillia japonica]|uniref:RNA-directed DNA polymerase n=1 Tax=Popillia japonica TaxID=7064 RepID=A0AAW1I9Z7_POPJA
MYRSLELSIDNGLLMWGYRVVIPAKFRKQLLEEIHGAHNGVVRMKALARQYFWWPGLDFDIEKFVKACDACMQNSSSPAKSALIKFEQSNHVYDRIHLDFLGPYHSKVYLIIVDSFSKWPEVYQMSKTDSTTTIDKLRDCFASEFEKFCRENGIVHITSAPYHPSTNGAAENSVSLLKAL